MGRPTGLELEDVNEVETAVGIAAAAETSGPVMRSDLQRETSALSDKIIEIITSGNWESLQPNSGNSVEVGDHQVCVFYDVKSSGEYRTWEWQGHIIFFNEEEMMYVPEYVYGNYFEPLLKTESMYENFLDRPSFGLTGIINNIERRANRTNYL
ncbi:uncharacterized protein [Physcomitrium patens]|uniref:Uncharacterized protein n=1 Tax=Physcomitrium patens TaxID=3218 RepID=A9T9V9_PHYPA|nr:uncharacterized protein LOC112281637 [Physcomitrium patens]PNR55122.1 hypothetical protein PHYPA_006015 [Physcomitrium patens]|eukprot:XP_024374155.1 uncharacterized protein LOC112281637 [Physcomitrella patens]